MKACTAAILLMSYVLLLNAGCGTAASSGNDKPEVVKQGAGSKVAPGTTVKDAEASKRSAEAVEKLKKLAYGGPFGLSFRADDKFPGGWHLEFVLPEILPILKDIPNLTSFVFRPEKEEWFAHLADLKTLRWLHVEPRQAGMSEQAFSYFRNLQQLEYLGMRDWSPGFSDAYKYLGELPNLQVVYSDGGPVTDHALEYLKRCKKLKMLAFTGYLCISDAGLQHLRGFEALEVLQFPTFAPVQLRSQLGLKDLKPDWRNDLAQTPKLKKLHLFGPGPLSGVDELQKLKPELVITNQPFRLPPQYTSTPKSPPPGALEPPKDAKKK